MNRAVRFLLYPFISFKGYLRRNITVVILGVSKEELLELLEKLKAQELSTSESRPQKQQSSEPQYVLDTSCIIDGRIAEVVQAGFLQGTLVVPDFVLQEVRGLADSSDALRRNKGRKGLEMVAKLHRDFPGSVRSLTQDRSPSREVDDELLSVARRTKASLITTDYNLGEMAKAQGIRVLNLHALAVALRPIFLPGDTFSLQLQHPGTEVGQGVGYLENGTMVVVEEARREVGKNVEVRVTRVAQSQTGVIVFAALVPAPVR